MPGSGAEQGKLVDGADRGHLTPSGLLLQSRVQPRPNQKVGLSEELGIGTPCERIGEREGVMAHFQVCMVFTGSRLSE